MGPWGEKRSMPKELLEKEPSGTERFFGGVILGLLLLVAAFIALAIFTAPISLPPVGWQGLVSYACGIAGFFIGFSKPSIAFFIFSFFGFGGGQ